MKNALDAENDSTEDNSDFDWNCMSGKKTDDASLDYFVIKY